MSPREPQWNLFADPRLELGSTRCGPTLRLLKGAHALGAEVVEAIDHVVDLIEIQTIELDVLIKGRLSGEDVNHGPIFCRFSLRCT